MKHNLALPLMPQQLNTIPDERMAEVEDFMQSDDFLQMINDNDLANISSLSDTPLPEQTQSQPQIQTLMQPLFGMQMPTPPSMEPNTLMGPSYHPVVGWYFPALPSSGMSTPIVPFPTIFDGYTPTTSLPTSAIPSGVSTPNPYSAPPKPKKKRKYGPAAFLEEQAKARLQNDLPLRDSPAKKAKSVAHPLRENQTLSIVQTCVCTDKEKHKIKRPRNAFIIYRSANSKKIIERLGQNDNQAVSRILGEAWRKESPQVKRKYTELAEQEKARHEAMYPGYKYQPGQSSRNKFGSQSCTCGAYEVNLRALRAREGVAEGEDSDVDEYMPSSRKSQPAPTAPMTMQTPLPDPSTFAFSTPSQRAEAEAYVENLKRKRDAATEIEEPLAKRRSPRTGKNNNISYAEPGVEEILGSAPIDAAKPHPSQSNTLALDTSPTLSAAGFATADSPARNTRNNSRSKAKTPSPPMEQTEFPFDCDVDTIQDIDWEALLQSSSLFVDGNDDNDCIAVADRRPSSGGRPGSQGSPTMGTRSRQKSVEPEGLLRRSSRKTSK